MDGENIGGELWHHAETKERPVNENAQGIGAHHRALVLPPIAAWLAARSIARGLPQPVADCGGYRVDTNAPDEIQRWVFPTVSKDLAALARGIRRPAYLVKACAAPEQLLAALPPGWQIHAPGFFMAGPDLALARPVCPPGYTLEVRRAGLVTEARVLAGTGEMAASGYSAETEEVFIYDRIVTAPGHRRRGLGRVLMAALRGAKVRLSAPERLVATEEGRALYASMGWRTLSAFSTGSRVG